MDRHMAARDHEESWTVPCDDNGTYRKRMSPIFTIMIGAQDRHEHDGPIRHLNRC
jgi:hypothetical protein